MYPLNFMERREVYACVSALQATGSLDQALARQLKNLLVQSGTNAQLITCYGGGDEVKMCWGEAIPMWYLKKYQTNGIYLFLFACAV